TVLAVLVLSSCDSQEPLTLPRSPDESVSTNAPPRLPEEVSFNEHIQPILSEFCYHCHGPDSGTREPKNAPLRLDRESDAFSPRENGVPVIIRGKPEESLLVKLIREKDPGKMMPPPESHKTLAAEHIAILEKWIEQGAKYEAHWSFLPVKRPEVPFAGN